MSESVESLPTWPFDRVDPLLPPPKLAELRERCPVSQVKMWNGSCSWLATRHSDFKTLLRSPDLSAEASRPNYPNSNENHAASRGSQVSFIRKDDPEHAVQRRMLTKTFSLSQIATMRPFVEELVDQLLDDLAAAPQPADLIEHLAEPLPSHVICEILAFPVEDSDFLNDRVNVWMNLDSPPAASAQATADLARYLEAVVDARIASPGEDLVSRLIHDHLLSGAISRADLLSMLNLLIIGGFDTTANMIALGTVLLLRYPDQLADLRANLDLMPGAVEEMLRFLSVAHHVAARVADADIDIAGVTIHEGNGVMASIPAANHDPEVFPEPEKFDVRRDARDHVAFNFGIHQCLGQNLARLELDVVFTKLLQRFPDLQLAVPESELEFRNSMIYGVRAVPVTF